jgi:dipeptidyl aminopeptidase/acylaminoacyl peptidase
MRSGRVAAAVAIVLVAACSRYETAGVAPEFRVPFRGPGTLAIVWHRGEPDEEPDRHLVVYAAGGAREIPLEQPTGVRFLSPHELLVSLELPASAIDQLPRTRLLRVDLRTGAREPLGAAGRYYDPAPSPDGRLLAVGVEVDDRGGSQLEVWDLGGERLRLGRRRESVEEPRWSPDGHSLAVAKMVQTGGDEAVALSGVSLPSARMFRLRRDLFGRAEPLHDGPPGGSATVAGSFPLWWDEDGIHARQRDGVARCSPEGTGCRLEYRAPEGRRVVDGRPLERGRALLLLVEASELALNPVPLELALAHLAEGRAGTLHVARGAHFLDLDWSPGERLGALERLLDLVRHLAQAARLPFL